MPKSRLVRIEINAVKARTDASRWTSAERGSWLAPLEIDVEGARREWLKPIRWVKPGILLLEQSVIFRGADAGEATYRLTAAFDEKTGKFRIVSKKKVPSKE